MTKFRSKVSLHAASRLVSWRTVQLEGLGPASLHVAGQRSLAVLKAVAIVLLASANSAALSVAAGRAPVAAAVWVLITGSV